MGDPGQLSEIDTGGAFVALAERLGHVELTENLRKRERWERRALEEFRSGDVEVPWRPTSQMTASDPPTPWEGPVKSSWIDGWTLPALAATAL
jgi:hypothetical protein